MSDALATSKTHFLDVPWSAARPVSMVCVVETPVGRAPRARDASLSGASNSAHFIGNVVTSLYQSLLKQLSTCSTLRNRFALRGLKHISDMRDAFRQLRHPQIAQHTCDSSASPPSKFDHHGRYRTRVFRVSMQTP